MQRDCREHDRSATGGRHAPSDRLRQISQSHVARGQLAPTRADADDRPAAHLLATQPAGPEEGPLRPPRNGVAKSLTRDRRRPSGDIGTAGHRPSISWVRTAEAPDRSGQAAGLPGIKLRPPHPGRDTRDRDRSAATHGSASQAWWKVAGNAPRLTSSSRRMRSLATRPRRAHSRCFYLEREPNVRLVVKPSTFGKGPRTLIGEAVRDYDANG